MSQHQRIERVDNIPLILYWLKQMGIVEIIDATFTPHTNWQSLSYGQLDIARINVQIYYSWCKDLGESCRGTTVDREFAWEPGG